MKRHRESTTRSRGRHGSTLILAAILLMASVAASAESVDSRSLRPLLLAPSEAKPSSAERHRALVYRSGLTRSIRQLERARVPSIPSHGARRAPHGRLGLQSRLNARRGELSRIDRALGRRDR